MKVVLISSIVSFVAPIGHRLIFKLLLELMWVLEQVFQILLGYILGVLGTVGKVDEIGDFKKRNLEMRILAVLDYLIQRTAMEHEGCVGTALQLVFVSGFNFALNLLAIQLVLQISWCQIRFEQRNCHILELVLGGLLFSWNILSFFFDYFRVKARACVKACNFGPQKSNLPLFLLIKICGLFLLLFIEKTIDFYSCYVSVFFEWSFSVFCWTIKRISPNWNKGHIDLFFNFLIVCAVQLWEDCLQIGFNLILLLSR